MQTQVLEGGTINGEGQETETMERGFEREEKCNTFTEFSPNWIFFRGFSL